MNELENNVTNLKLINKLTTLDKCCLPHGTELIVNHDGTGDFTNLYDAITFLRGKYCPGVITINIKSGTYNMHEQCEINGALFNLSQLIIKGDGIDNTILVNDVTEDSSYCLLQFRNNLNVFLRDITLKHSKGSKNTYYSRGINNSTGSYLYALNTKLYGFSIGIASFDNSVLNLQNNVNVDQCNAALACDNVGNICTSWGATINISNAVYGFTAHRCSRVSLFNATVNYTNVSTRTLVDSYAVLYSG